MAVLDRRHLSCAKEKNILTATLFNKNHVFPINKNLSSLHMMCQLISQQKKKEENKIKFVYKPTITARQVIISVKKVTC